MLLRFVCQSVVQDFELYSAQGESVVGFYDAVRSAVLDITADEIVLKDSTTAAISVLQSAGKDVADIIKQQTTADYFSKKPVDLFVVEKAGKDETVALFMKFPEGLGALAKKIAEATAGFAKDLNTGFEFRAEALPVLQGLDSEFDSSMLPTEIASKEISLEEDLPMDEEPAEPAPAPKAKRQRKAV